MVYSKPCVGGKQAGFPVDKPVLPRSLAIMEKDSSLKTLHIYCTDGVEPKLVALAKAHRRSKSSEVQALIEEAYAKYLSDKHKTDLRG